MSIISVNKDNFENEVLNEESIVLVDFFADWCGPCKMLAPILEDVAKEKDVKICKVNIDEEGDLVTKYNIMSVPTLMTFKNGEILTRVMGVQSKQAILEMFD